MKNFLKTIGYSKNRLKIILIIVAIIFISVIFVVDSINKTKEYNNDVEQCYQAIKNDLDWDKFISIIEKRKDDENFKNDAYEVLYQAIDDRIEEIKNGKQDDKLAIWLYNIQPTSKDMEERFNEKYDEANLYSNINKANTYIENEKYDEAYNLLSTIIKCTNNQEIKDEEITKQSNITDKAMEQAKQKAQEMINKTDYSSAKSILEPYKDLGNQTILDMYNNVTNEVNRIESDKKAQEEAEKKKQEEEERKRQQEELDAKKDQLTINKNGKKIWKVCMTSNTFRFQATYRGNGNFIVKLLDSNQVLESLIVNEIGDYNVDKTVRVQKGEYYYLETYVSDGSWNGTWWGTYGD